MDINKTRLCFAYKSFRYIKAEMMERHTMPAPIKDNLDKYGNSKADWKTGDIIRSKGGCYNGVSFARRHKNI